MFFGPEHWSPGQSLPPTYAKQRRHVSFFAGRCVLPPVQSANVSSTQITAATVPVHTRPAPASAPGWLSAARRCRPVRPAAANGPVIRPPDSAANIETIASALLRLVAPRGRGGGGAAAHRCEIYRLAPGPDTNDRFDTSRHRIVDSHATETFIRRRRRLRQSAIR